MNASAVPEGDGVLRGPVIPAALLYPKLSLLAGLALLLAGGPIARASGVITNCTEDALRSAVADGGAVTFGGDCTITLSQPIALAAGGTTIDAAGHQVTISGGGAVPLFRISGQATLLGLTLANGKSATAGGALYLNSSAVVVASNCVFTGNSVTASNGVAGSPGSNSSGVQGGDGGNGGAGVSATGGAIWNGGTLTLITCTLSNNTAIAGNGGDGGDGGTATGSLAVGGDGGSGGPGGASYGGAVYNGGTLTLIDCTVGANTATGGDGGSGGAGGNAAFDGRAGQGGGGSPGLGGGVYNAQNLTVRKCTFSGNTGRGGSSAAGGTQSSGAGNDGYRGADARGAGLCSTWWTVVTNSTFYGNIATGGDGGDGGPGIGTLSFGGRGGNGGNGVGGGFQNSGTATLVNCTFSDCGAHGGTNGVAGSGSFANDDGQPGQALGGDIASTGGSCTLMNSLIVSAEFGGCGYGTFPDGGYNMTSDNSITLGALSFPNTTDPKLGDLSMNGGATATMPLLPESPALDQIPPQRAPATDQRGVPRPLNNQADIGAYESELTSAPVIATQPTDQSTPVGDSATFTVFAAGASPLSYQWYIAGSPISGATDSSYTVGTAATNNVGPYSVIITNTFGSISSDLASIRLLATITSQPANAAVPLGSNASFSVTATGDPPPTYQWFFEDTAIDRATNSVLTLTNVQLESIGNYSVEVSNPYSTLSSTPARLEILPTITDPPTNLVLNAGDSGTFAVSAVGSPVLSYQWQFNGANIDEATNTFLNLSDVQQTNIGSYRVVVSNPFGATASDPARLDLPPSISQQPANQVVRAGASAWFSVQAGGSPPLAYAWYVNGVSIPGATSSTFAIPSAQPNQIGAYSVRVTNAFGGDTSAQAQLDLLPTLLTVPANQVVRAGASASFYVTAVGSQPLTYQWRLNGINLPGQTNTSLTIASVQSSDVGAYSVLVRNPFGATTSPPATLAIGVAPSIVVGPADQAVKAGTNATFAVVAGGTEPLIYQWQFWGTDIAGATRTAYTVNNAGTNQIGQFSILVTNAFGSATATATLNLLPTILTQPQSQAVATGAPTELCVSAAGTEPLNYQWHFNGTNTLQGATNPCFGIAEFQAADAGAYTVVVTNAYGSATSSPAILTAGVAPVITIAPTNQVLAVGGTATLNVVAGGTDPLRYQWRLLGTNLPGQTSTSLVLANARPSRAGPYTVVITNVFGSITSSPATLLFRPTILFEPSDVLTLAGSSVSFCIGVAGTEPLHYQWLFNQSMVLPGASEDCLTLSNVQPADAGVYTLWITNDFGMATSGPVALNLLPTVLVQPASQSVLVGSNANFSVTALATASYQWRFNGSAIPGATASEYRLVTVGLTNRGLYDVVLGNEFGVTTSLVARLDVVLPFTISGRVQLGTDGLPGVTVSAGTNQAVTDERGDYTISGLSSNAYTVTPSLACYLFEPASHSPVIVGPGNNGFGVDFAATNDFHVIAGTIRTQDGLLISGPVTVFLLGTNRNSVVDGTDGQFSFTDVCPGVYSVSLSSQGYLFDPPSASVTVPPDNAAVQFQATPVFSISGQISNAVGTVQVRIIGAGTSNLVTAVGGTYSLPRLMAGTYQVTPQMAGCRHFEPPTREVTIGPSAAGIDFNSLQDAFVISGRLTNGPSGVSNVLVSLGPGPLLTYSRGDGSYAFSNLCAGAYTVTPSAGCYEFTPPALSVSVGPADAPDADFAAAPFDYSISGYVLEGTVGLSNVMVVAGGTTNFTGPDGSYLITGLCPGVYSVTPVLGCHFFNPSLRTVEVGPSIDQVNFLAYTNDLYTVQGRITSDGIQGMAGVNVTVGERTAVTDSNGNYTLSHLCPGAYSVTPNSPGFGFAPPSRPLQLVSDTNGLDFVGFSVYALSGHVTENGLGLSNVTVQAGTQITNTDVTGAYVLANLRAGTYVVTPTQSCHLFIPASRTVSIAANTTGIDFFGIANNVLALRGSVTEGIYPLPGVSMQMGDQPPTTTAANGTYSFLNVCEGSYTITPSLAGYIFHPSSLTFSVASDVNGLNFAAVPVFTISQLSNGWYQLDSFGTTGALYYVDISTNLVEWQPLLTNSAPLHFLDEDASPPQKFYRLSR